MRAASRRMRAWLKDSALTAGVALLVVGGWWLYHEVTTGDLSGWRVP